MMKYCNVFVWLIVAIGYSINEASIFSSKQLTSNRGYPIRIVLETTADWTDLTFNNTEFVYIKDSILTNNPFSIGLFSVSKKSYDSTLTRIAFDIFLIEKLPKNIVFSLRKGGIGQAKVYFLSNQKETIAVYVNDINIPGDAQNVKQFLLKSKIIQNAYKLHSETLPSISNVNFSRKVLAFYFPWYYPENWSWTGKLSIAHQPQLGLYLSSDEHILHKHIDMAKQAGIDGFICSWWGINSVTDQNLKQIARLCKENNFTFTIYLEQAKSFDDMKKSISYLDSCYASHSNILLFGEKPVIFIYNRILDSIPVDSLRLIKSNFLMVNYGYKASHLNGFIGYHEFLPPVQNLTELKKTYRLAKQVAHSKGKLFAAPVIPGFDDRNVNNHHTFINRQKGKYYKNQWEIMLAIEPDWVLITSFNEWFEGTEIEPSKEFGDFYLKLTKTYSQKFKNN